MDWLKKVLDQATVAFRAMTAAQRASMLMLALTIVVALGMVVALGARPKYVALTSGLDKEQTAEVVRLLDEAGEEYKVDQAKGSIMIHADRKDAWVGKIMKVVPREKIYDYERYLADGTNIAITERHRKETMRIAQAGELQKMIGSLEGIERCRVEIKPEGEQEYVMNPEKVGVGVIVTTKAGRNLDQQTANAIIDLIGSTVRNSDARLVTVVDTRSSRTFRKEDPESEVFIGRNRLNLRREVERFYRQKLEDFIAQTQYEGAVQVYAELDLDRIKDIVKDLDTKGKGAFPIWTESRKLDSVGATGPSGPVGDAVAPPGGTSTGPTAPNNGTPSTAKQNESRVRNEYDVIFREIVHAPGNVIKLTASVVITARKVSKKNDKGETTTVYELPKDTEKENWRSLVASILGKDPKDANTEKEVTVCYWNPPQEAPPPAIPVEPKSIKEVVANYAPYARLAGVMLLASAALFFLYSLGRRAAVAPPAEVVVSGGPTAAEALGEGGSTEPEEAKFQQMQERISTLVEQDPRKVSSLVKRWLSREG